MKQTTKKILKYVIGLALLVGVAFAIVAIFFPTPKPDESFKALQSIEQNATFDEIITSNQNLYKLMQKVSVDESEWTKKLNEFENINSFYNAFSKINQQYCQQLAFAKNNSKYNEQTKKIKTEIKTTTSILDEYKDYLDEYFNNFYNQSKNASLTKESVTPYIAALEDLNARLLKSYAKILECASKILPSQTQTFGNNTYSQTKISNLIIWASAYINNLQDFSTLYISNFNDSIANLDFEDYKNCFQSQNFVEACNSTKLEVFFENVVKADLQTYTSQLEDSAYQNIVLICNHYDFEY